jgi:hypothetical protein
MYSQYQEHFTLEKLTNDTLPPILRCQHTETIKQSLLTDLGCRGNNPIVTVTALHYPRLRLALAACVRTSAPIDQTARTGSLVSQLHYLCAVSSHD